MKGTSDPCSFHGVIKRLKKGKYTCSQIRVNNSFVISFSSSEQDPAALPSAYSADRGGWSCVHHDFPLSLAVPLYSSLSSGTFWCAECPDPFHCWCWLALLWSLRPSTWRRMCGFRHQQNFSSWGQKGFKLQISAKESFPGHAGEPVTALWQSEHWG